MVDRTLSADTLMFAKMREFKYDPLGFVMFAFPWGEEGKPLENMVLRAWQKDVFEDIRAGLLRNKKLVEDGFGPKVIKIAIAGGRGIGKSALFGMLNTWLMSCWIGGGGVVTANTDTQLKDETMAETGRWATMSITGGWFDKKSKYSLTPTAEFGKSVEKQLLVDNEKYAIKGKNWSIDNTEAFRGNHNSYATMIQFDEASGIPEEIWRVCEGNLTENNICLLWVVISNSTKNSGRFFDVFQGDELWNCKKIGIPDVPEMSQELVTTFAKTYGVDSEEYRVEILAEFPTVSYVDSFIDRTLIVNAIERVAFTDPNEPLIMGVDVAHMGSDKSIIRLRQGKNGGFDRFVFEKLDSMRLADEIGKVINRLNPDVVFIDGSGGYGAGPIDRLRQLGFKNIVSVQGQHSPSVEFKDKYMNKRAETWDKCVAWLIDGGVLREEDGELISELGLPEKIIKDTGKIAVEKKVDIKKRLGRSPDDADAFMLTFSHPVRRKFGEFENKRPQTYKVDYNPFENI